MIHWESVARRLAHESALRAVHREIVAVRGGGGRIGGAVKYAADPAAWRRWAEEFYAKHAQHLQEALHLSEEQANRYAAHQRDALVDGGVTVIETWETEAAARLAAMKLEAEAMDYRHVVAWVRDQPWAILPEKLAVILDLIRFRSEGGKLSDADIAARVGVARPHPDIYVTSEAEGIAAVQRGEPLAAATTGRARAGSVAVLPIFGVIAHRADALSEMSGGTSIERMTARYRQALADPAIGAVVFDVNSPGGGVYGVQELAAEIRSGARQKPHAWSVNGMAASAALWLASSAGRGFITSSSEAGSVGVYTAHEDLSGALEQQGVKVEMIASSGEKIEQSPYQPLSEEARQHLQGRVNEYAAQFEADVAKGRGVPVEQVRRDFGKGRVLGARAAVDVGMLDEIGSLEDAIRWASRQARSASQASAEALEAEAEAARVRVLLG